MEYFHPAVASVDDMINLVIGNSPRYSWHISLLAIVISRKVACPLYLSPLSDVDRDAARSGDGCLFVDPFAVAAGLSCVDSGAAYSACTAAYAKSAAAAFGFRGVLEAGHGEVAAYGHGYIGTFEDGACEGGVFAGGGDDG